MENVIIELTPYQAMEIARFFGDFLNSPLGSESGLGPIKAAVNAYNKQLDINLTDEQFNDAVAEDKVNALLGKYAGK